MAFMIYLIFTLFIIIKAEEDHHNHKHEMPDFKDISDFFKDTFMHDMEHLKEDVKDNFNVDIDSKTSDHELDFYYFRIHDFDDNQMLDGLEILMALNHIIDHDALLNRHIEGAKPDDPAELVAKIKIQKQWENKFQDDSKIIDQLLNEYDWDRDGYLSYAEFAHARATVNH